jgi:hypothetical protein
MKKVVLVLLAIVICGCGEVNNKVEDKTVTSDHEEEVVEVVEEKKDDNPIKLALYINGKKVDSYSSPMTIYTDIVSLECYYTDEDEIVSGNFKDVFNKYYSNYVDIDKYKIGYKIMFDIPNETVTRYIYRPGDVFDYFNFIQTYLYDDIHQDSSWYSHVEDSEYNDNTLLTSIKLTASTDIDKVSSSIKITVFSYDSDDINDKGEYIGNNSYTVVINRG